MEVPYSQRDWRRVRKYTREPGRGFARQHYGSKKKKKYSHNPTMIFFCPRKTNIPSPLTPDEEQEYTYEAQTNNKHEDGGGLWHILDFDMRRNLLPPLYNNHKKKKYCCGTVLIILYSEGYRVKKKRKEGSFLTLMSAEIIPPKDTYGLRLLWPQTKQWRVKCRVQAY